MDSNQDTREKLMVARLSVLSNTLLIIAKLVVGLITGSVSIVSEAIHSGLDLLAALITYFSVKAAAKPADREHQFGHGKIENLSGYIEATLIFFAAALIIHEAIDKIIRGTGVEFIWLGLVVMALSIALNWFVSRRLMTVAKRYNSVALEADALHLATDVYTSLGVLIGLGLVQLLGIKIIDPIMAMIVALLIIKAAYRLSRKSLRDLCDVKLTDEEETTIRRIIDEHSEKFVGYHQMRTRRAGNTLFVDLHLVMQRNISVEDAHTFTDHLERDIAKIFPNIHVLIHIEPCDNNCDICKIKCKK